MHFHSILINLKPMQTKISGAGNCAYVCVCVLPRRVAAVWRVWWWARSHLGWLPHLLSSSSLAARGQGGSQSAAGPPSALVHLPGTRTVAELWPGLLTPLRSHDRLRPLSQRSLGCRELRHVWNCHTGTYLPCCHWSDVLDGDFCEWFAKKFAVPGAGNKNTDVRLYLDSYKNTGQALNKDDDVQRVTGERLHPFTHQQKPKLEGEPSLKERGGQMNIKLNKAG